MPLTLISPARSEKILGEATSTLHKHDAVRGEPFVKLRKACRTMNGT